MEPVTTSKVGKKLLKNKKVQIALSTLPLIVLSLFIGLVVIASSALSAGAEESNVKNETAALEEGVAAPSELALSDIPTDFLNAYIEAGSKYGIDWSILAGIGKVECDHGKNQQNGCNPPGTMNSAGARGYMQFIGSTWRKGLGQRTMEPRNSPPTPEGKGYATDCDGDGAADPWNVKDITCSAARYLVASNVKTNIHDAIFAYNHAEWYVEKVLKQAVKYRTAQFVGDPGTQSTAGQPTSPITDESQITSVQGIRIHVSASSQLDQMLNAMKSDVKLIGIRIGGGGYRSPAGQIAVRRSNCGNSTYAIYEMPSSSCSPPTAKPGSSMHERGLAVDFTCNGSTLTRNSPCFGWLAQHAAQYGFYNFPKEAWHWSTNGH